MKQNTRFLMTAIFTVLFMLIFTATGFSQSLTIEQIMDKYDANELFDTGHMKARVEVTDKFGTSINVFETYSKRNGDTLIIVTDGPDAGQKILRLENSVYLYYPEAEEVIRLQGSALKDSVMGSDFTYEDLTGDNSILNNYNGKLIGEETFDGATCYHVVLTAKTKKQLYQKQELWLDKETFAARKTVVYSASGKALSESVSSDLKNFSSHWVAQKSTMKNLLKKNSSTTMYISDIEINVSIPASYFDRNELAF